MRITADKQLLVDGFRNWWETMQKSSNCSASFVVFFGNVEATGMVHINGESAFDQRMGKQTKKVFTKVGSTNFEVQNISKG
eukprot:8351164-Heterocapsa_arctica.AAC.1